MKTLVTGHRLHKLEQYDISWIRWAIHEALNNTVLLSNISYGLSGMASGVDLWFCEVLREMAIPYEACIPFKEQAETMDKESAQLRQNLIDCSAKISYIKNSYMVERTDSAIVIFDGNKGGTHNVFQQLIEKNKPFVWINPVGKKIWEMI